MNQRAALLARRRERLVWRSDRLRRQMAVELRVLQPAFTWADRLQDAWHWLRSNPLAAMAGTLILTVYRPRRVVDVGVRAWSAWKLLRRLRGNRPD